MILFEDDDIALTQYTHDDDIDMYECWNDIDTQHGYNVVFTDSFDEFIKFDIEKFRFWVTVIDKRRNEKVGTLRLGLDKICPDLAIWIYPQYRNIGYGTRSFRLALKFIFQNYRYKEISAGCYSDNTYSMKMLIKVGFDRYPDGDAVETNCFTGESIVQKEFRISRDTVIA